MYDWPEARAEVDRSWEIMRANFIAHGIDAPRYLIRRNADMPAVPGGIRSENGAIIAPDPATLDPSALDLDVLWRHPQLLLCGTCWGPMELGLQEHVQVIGQSNYEGVAGGAGVDYSSAIVTRKGVGKSIIAPENGEPILPLALFRGRKLGFNEHRSMSGLLALKRDLDGLGQSLSLFSEMIETGAHRSSIQIVARGDVDFAAIDCRSWMLAQRYEPAAGDLHVVGWTERRKGLPFIRAKDIEFDFLM